MTTIAQFSVDDIITRNEAKYGTSSFTTLYIILGVICIVLLLFYAKSILTIKKHNEYIQKLIETGDYKVYLDGKLLEEPEGIDVRNYIKQIDEEKKIIRLTTNHTTQVYVNNYKR